jgi:hypothetical protein
VQVLGAVVSLVMVAGACGDDTPAAEEGPDAIESVDSTVSSTVAAPAEPPPFPAPSLESVGLSLPDACPLPWLPVFAQLVQSYPVEQPLTEVRPELGTPIDAATLQRQAPDSDGDGTPDEVLEDLDGGAAFGLRRGDGEVIFAVEGGAVSPWGFGSRAGDLDGDGRDELFVHVSRDQTYDLLVVPGSVPPGRHDPREVGTGLLSSSDLWLVPVGDVDRDGAEDLMFAHADRGPIVASGTAVMDAVGGTLTDPTSIATVPPDLRGVVLLGDESPVPVPLVTTGVDATGAAELRVLTDPPITLRTDRVPAVDAQVFGFQTDGQRYVRLMTDMDRSGNWTEFIWNLDDPCAGPTAAG